MVASVQELMAQQAVAAVKVTGAHHSSWNGSVTELPVDDPRRGVVGPDQSLRYHPVSVIAVLQDMFDRAGQQRDLETLKAYRQALRAVFHENIHLLAAAGTSYASALDAYYRPANQVLEEAVTELHTQNALDDYIDELGLEAIAPGIKAVRTEPEYQEYLPAAKNFSQALGSRAKLSGAKVIHRIAVVNAAEKFRVAASGSRQPCARPLP
ncbi:hypothetical protein EV646_107290 [Kribbella antiqua]|uniref:Uncharacterized protein n=1 Tax=Kribbella antiqua TaxID=2512217 RepID=A0A4R2IPI8_9ACTN|nr:hypothetical protein [Kribbella antiqua]TCO46266.1 hypothetical protein EV646_107290 [Kribbella antiqua]